MTQIWGIDISRWQGDFNVKASNAGFVIIKAGGSDSKTRYRDSQFEANYKKCKDAGIPCGAYYFGNDTTVEAAEKSAEHFLSLLKDKQFEYPVYYDVESKSMQTLSVDALTKVVDAFCHKVESAGYYVGIYSSTYWFKSEMAETVLNKYTHWVAQWSKNKPMLANSSVDMWQFGGGETNYLRSTKVNGVKVDQNYCYKDFPSIIKAAGLNGYAQKPTPIVNTETLTCNYKVVTTEHTALVVRDNPNIDAKMIKTYPNNELISISQIVDKWGKTPDGWVSMDYLIQI